MLTGTSLKPSLFPSKTIYSPCDVKYFQKRSLCQNFQHSWSFLWYPGHSQKAY